MKTLNFLLRLCLVLACLLYAFWKVDLSRFGHVLSQFNLTLVIIAHLSLFGVLVLPALRINFLCRGEAGFSHAYQATLLGLGVNNILPAKLGELAKGIYLRKEVAIPLSRGLNIVFWERFSDLNAVLLLALVNAAFFVQESIVTLTLLGTVASMWCFLILHQQWPKVADRLLHLLPFKVITSFASRFLSQLREHFKLRFLILLFAYAIAAWVFLAGLPYFVLWGIADLNLSFGQILSVIVISSFAMAIPSSPGAIGVYEASIVAPLTHFGIDKEQALAAAIVLHMIQYIPTTLGALYVMAKTGLRMKTFRQLETT